MSASNATPPTTSESPRTDVPNITVQIGGHRVSRLFFYLGWAGFGFCLLLLLGQAAALSDYFDTTEGIEERYHSGEEYGEKKIAIISVSGTIVDGSGYVKKQIDRIRDDEKVEAVVVRIVSPGGTITGSDYILHHLNKLREEKNIPLVVSMGSMAASGGYYVAMAVGDQEKSIYAEPTTTTGSIGVIIPHYDLSGLMGKLGVTDDSIVSHPRKQLLSMTKPLEGERLDILKAYLDEAFVRFKEVVKQGRPAFRDNPELLEALATGEIFTAVKAEENGLVDELGFIEDAIERARELAGLAEDETRVVELRQPEPLFPVPWVTAAKSPSFDLGQWLDLHSPQAYYLATTLPSILSCTEQHR